MATRRWNCGIGDVVGSLAVVVTVYFLRQNLIGIPG